MKHLVCERCGEKKDEAIPASHSFSTWKATLKKGKTLTLKPAVTPLTSVQKVTYRSSNKKVATVTSKGVIKAKKKGTAVITVKSGSKTAKCKITVK